MRSAARQNAYATLTQGRTGVPPVFIGGVRIPGALEQPKNLHRTPQSSQTAQGQSTKIHRASDMISRQIPGLLQTGVLRRRQLDNQRVLIRVQPVEQTLQI